MHLPVRLAVSLPIVIVILGAFAIAIALPEGRRPHPVYGMPNAVLYAFLAGIPALLLVIPNIAAAQLANRYSDGSFGAFAAIVVIAVLGVTLLEVGLFNNFFRSMGGFISATDWRLYAALLVNAGVLLVIAAWIGRRTGA